MARLEAAHVVIVGIGGVGSWAAEALARSGCGRLTLIDLDHVAESNINRQVLALESTLGAAKVAVMAERIADIAPDAHVVAVDDFVTAENAAALIPADAGAVVEACDQVRAKAAVVALCRARSTAIVVCGAAGGRRDPLALRRSDLGAVTGDRLLAALRARLRRDHGFAGGVFGVDAIHAPTPPPIDPSRPRGPGPGPAAGRGGAPLACAGYGSLVTVTATMGLAAAQRAMDLVTT
jgi:tRNA A37 threonylcarbamoyladenosine dehydratase